jgi:hypothetical protein
MRDGQGNYLANLVLYPSRPEFTAFLPENTQASVGSDLRDGARHVLLSHSAARSRGRAAAEGPLG